MDNGPCLQTLHAASGLHNLVKFHKAPHHVLTLLVLLLHQPQFLQKPDKLIDLWCDQAVHLHFLTLALAKNPLGHFPWQMLS